MLLWSPVPALQHGTTTRRIRAPHALRRVCFSRQVARMSHRDNLSAPKDSGAVPAFRRCQEAEAESGQGTQQETAARSLNPQIRSWSVRQPLRTASSRQDRQDAGLKMRDCVASAKRVFRTANAHGYRYPTRENLPAVPVKRRGFLCRLDSKNRCTIRSYASG